MSPSRLNDCWLIQHTKSEVLWGLAHIQDSGFLRTWFQHPRRKPGQRVHCRNLAPLDMAWGHMPAFMQIVVVKSWLDI